MIKPKRLKKGDTLAIVSMSWGGADMFPHIYERGLKRLTEFGFKIVEFPTARMSTQELYENPQLRAKDINDAFADDTIDGIMCSTGGDECNRILPYLDQEIIKNNPKFFMGYSDVTTLTTFFNQLGLVSFNGPDVMSGFGDPIELYTEYVKFLETFLFHSWASLEYKPYSQYVNSYCDWSDTKNIHKPTSDYRNNKGWRFIQGKGAAEGKLFGGCIEVFEFTKSTEFWPNEMFWNDKILFFETSEEKPSITQIIRFLRNYGLQGVFDQINGLLFGRARDYTDEEKKELDEAIKKVLREFNQEDLHVVTNVDFGHTEPQIILPLGINLKIDSDNKTLSLTESAWSD